MTSFNDGPAVGKVLGLRRAPLFLRVVVDPKGEVDALDQLDDKPRPSETVTVYRLVENRGMVHVCSRSKGKNTGGYFAMATYEVCPEQPDAETARSATGWPEWCHANAEWWVEERAKRRAEAAEEGN